MDCTIGFGGHSNSILKKLNLNGMLIGLDLDPYALNETNRKLKKQNKNFSLHNCCYSVFPQILEKMGIKKVDGFLFDLGISSYQVDSTHRGFSYQKNADLDMRFNNLDKNKKTAKDIINTITEKQLSKYFRIYGDIKDNIKIAKAIVSYRKIKKIETTFDLKKAICTVLPYEDYKKLSKIFQVIRILVNDEIQIIKKTLISTLEYLSIGGRIAVISFHSIEDRIIKHFFKSEVIYKNASYDIEFNNFDTTLKAITKKPVIESNSQINSNPRSRSAKLRVAERIK